MEPSGYLPRMTIDPIQPPVGAAPWRRRARRFAIVLSAVLACVVLLCCIGGAYVLYDGRRAPREQREMEAFADALCRDLLDGNADAVYAALSADARDGYTAAEFARGLAAQGHVTRCDVEGATYLFLLLAYVVIVATQTDGTRSIWSSRPVRGGWTATSSTTSMTRPAGGGGGFGD